MLEDERNTLDSHGYKDNCKPLYSCFSFGLIFTKLKTFSKFYDSFPLANAFKSTL